MATAYVSTATGAVVGSYLLPDDDDDIDAASVDVPFEGIADDIRRLADLNHVASVMRIMRHAEYTSAFIFTGSGWEAQGTTGALIWFPIDGPEAATITALSCQIDPPGGHGALPGTMPQMKLYRIQVSGGTLSTLQTYNDGSGTVGIYEPEHSFGGTVTSPPTMQKGVYRYMVGVSCESGANSAALSLVKGVFVTFLTTKLDEAP